MSAGRLPGVFRTLRVRRCASKAAVAFTIPDPAFLLSGCRSGADGSWGRSPVATGFSPRGGGPSDRSRIVRPTPPTRPVALLNGRWDNALRSPFSMVGRCVASCHVRRRGTVRRRTRLAGRARLVLSVSSAPRSARSATLYEPEAHACANVRQSCGTRRGEVLGHYVVGR